MEMIQIGEITIEVTRKKIKNVHLSVYPPDGRVRLAVPFSTRIEVARAYAISKLAWIRKQQEAFCNQVREEPREYKVRESHYLWGRRYLLAVIEKEDKPSVLLDHRIITLCVRPGSNLKKRQEIIHEWHKNLLHSVISKYIDKWEPKLHIKVNAYFLQKMKTKWGSCNHKAGNIRLNTELVKKPKDLLEYVIVHEMIHLIEPTHNDKFQKLLNKFYPSWKEARVELNELPLSILK